MLGEDSLGWRQYVDLASDTLWGILSPLEFKSLVSFSSLLYRLEDLAKYVYIKVSSNSILATTSSSFKHSTIRLLWWDKKWTFCMKGAWSWNVHCKTDTPLVPKYKSHSWIWLVLGSPSLTSNFKISFLRLSELTPLVTCSSFGKTRTFSKSCTMWKWSESQLWLLIDITSSQLSESWWIDESLCLCFQSVVNSFRDLPSTIVRPMFLW